VHRPQRSTPRGCGPLPRRQVPASSAAIVSVRSNPADRRAGQVDPLGLRRSVAPMRRPRDTLAAHGLVGRKSGALSPILCAAFRLNAPVCAKPKNGVTRRGGPSTIQRRRPAIDGLPLDWRQITAVPVDPASRHMRGRPLDLVNRPPGSCALINSVFQGPLIVSTRALSCVAGRSDRGIDAGLAIHVGERHRRVL
jgi:hypothetical protein